MAAKALPEQSVLLQLLRYEPETGKLFWLPRGPEWFSDGKQASSQNAAIFNGKYSGTEAITAFDAHGYRVGNILCRQHRAHRAIWAMSYGEWPNFIDHINGVRSDNRLENLRSVSKSENSQNMCRRSDNITGVTGVCWHAAAQKWVSSICAGGVSKHLGLFSEFSDAVDARKKAEEIMGFHKNHGRAA